MDFDKPTPMQAGGVLIGVAALVLVIDKLSPGWYISGFIPIATAAWVFMGLGVVALTAGLFARISSGRGL